MRLNRAAPLSGIAFVVFFIASVVVSSVPKSSASDRDWLAAYATHAKQAGHLATGILLVLAALSLLVFLTHLWTRVLATGRLEAVSPLPLVAAGVSAACIAIGGVLMGSIGGSTLIGNAPLPGPDLLRLGNDAGFAMVGLAGMLAASVSVAAVSVQARSAGLFGQRLFRFSMLVAVLLLASFAFVPILGLLIWLVAVAVTLLRDSPALRRDGALLAARETA